MTVPGGGGSGVEVTSIEKETSVEGNISLKDVSDDTRGVVKVLTTLFEDFVVD